MPTIVQALLGVALLLVGWTALNLRGGAADDKDSPDREHAVGAVRECEKEGPISPSGVGYWWSCKVLVDPEGEDAYETTFSGSQFEPADEGKEFPLISAGLSSNNWSRADVPANGWAVLVTAGGLLLGLITLGMAVRRMLGRR